MDPNRKCYSINNIKLTSNQTTYIGLKYASTLEVTTFSNYR
jgi:hypothetical protein